MLGKKQSMKEQVRVPVPFAFDPESFRGHDWQIRRKTQTIERVNKVLDDPQLDEAFALNYNNGQLWPEDLVDMIDGDVRSFASSDSTRRSKTDRLRSIANTFEEYLENYECDKHRIVGAGLAERLEELERRVEGLESA